MRTDGLDNQLPDFLVCNVLDVRDSIDSSVASTVLLYVARW